MAKSDRDMSGKDRMTDKEKRAFDRGERGVPGDSRVAVFGLSSDHP